MTTRGAAIQGILATLGLAGAYATWQREPERAAGEVVVLDVTKKELTKVRYEEGPKWVELEWRIEADSDGPAPWIRVAARPETKAPERELRGNSDATKLLEKFAPLRATRALGILAADKLKEVGLDAPKKKLEVTARGAKQVFQIGSAPFGFGEPYLREEKDGRVFVPSGSVVSELEAAAVRLIDRTLHNFAANEFDELTIAAGEKRRELLQTGAKEATLIGTQTSPNLKLAPKNAPDKPDATAKNWHDKVWRLLVTDALGKGEKPTAGEPRVAVRVDYTTHGKMRGFIELGRVMPSPAAPPAAPSTPPSSAPPAPEIYARTEHAAGWVKLPTTADDLIKEGEKLATE